MEKNRARLHGGMRTEANGGARRHGRPGCARRHGCPGRARSGHTGRARGDALAGRRFRVRCFNAGRACGRGASPITSTRCAQAGRTGDAGQERRAAREGKGERTARRVRPRRNRAGRAGARSSWLYSFPRLDAMRTGRAHRGRRARKARGARGKRRKNGAMRPPAQEQGRACRSAQQMALQLPPSRRDAHRPGAQGAQGKKGARRAWEKAKERRDASARAGTGPDTARGGGEQGSAEPKKPARKGRAHRSGLRGRQSGAEIEGEMRREQPRTGAAARRSRGNEPCVAAARKRGMRAEKSGNRRDCPPVRMGAPVARKHGKGRGVVLAVWMDGATVRGIRWRAAGCRKRGAVPGAPPIGRKGSALLRRPCRRQRKRRCPCRPAGQKDAGKVARGIVGRTAG